MATITKLKSGHWRVQIRRKQAYASETFLRHEDARKWAVATEHQVDQAENIPGRACAGILTFGDLIDLYIEDCCEVKKASQLPKLHILEILRTELGRVRSNDLTRIRLIQFGKNRRRTGVPPRDLSVEIGYIKLIISHAASVHGLGLKTESVDLARVALKHFGLIA